MIFSIIVPVYNVEKYIHRCIDSILNQTFEDFECILVDDSSPDSCGMICDQYAAKDDRIKVIHKENGGVSEARNVALEVARGEYICFVDSDDYVENDFLMKIQESICEKDADVIVFGYKVISKNAESKIVYDSNLSNREIKEKFISDEYLALAWNKCYKKDLFENRKFPVGLVYEDMFLVPQIIYDAKNIAVIKKSLYNYDCTNNNSITKNVDSRKQYHCYLASKNNAEFAVQKSMLCINVCMYNALTSAVFCLKLNEKDGLLTSNQIMELQVAIKQFSAYVEKINDNKKYYKYCHDMSRLAIINREPLAFIRYTLKYILFKSVFLASKLIK